MTCRNKRNIYIATAAMGLFLAIGIVLSSIGVATARYQKSAMVSVAYRRPTATSSTVSAQGSIYDFGCWFAGAQTDPAGTVILAQTAPLNGTLRFAFDDVTAEEKDIALQTNVGVSGLSGNYTVNEADGQLSLPFTLIISAQNRSGVAYLDVEWIPAGAQKATQTARYLIALNPDQACAAAESAPTFDNSCGFLTRDLLWLSINAPADGDGMMLAHGANINGKFTEGTRYHTRTYPQGITLLADSVLYIPHTASGKQELLIDRNGSGTTDPVKISAGSSDTLFTTTAQTPAADQTALEVTGANTAIVSRETPLTLTVKECKALRDTSWNDSTQAGAQLCWELQRLSDGQFHKVTVSDGLKLTVSRTDGGGTVTIAAPTCGQPAGTYQLVLQQTYNGYPTDTSVVTFFIDYR